MTMMKVRDVIRMLEHGGWTLRCMRGSHRQFCHQTRAGRVTVAGHPNDDINRGILNSIRTQAGLK